jgi:flagellar M-ring protein FliF
MENAIAEPRVLQLWSGLAPGARVGLVVGVVVIAAISIALALWSNGSEYRVLFSQLSDADAANIVEQLKRQKIPYRLADAGATIEVPAEQVYETRLTLVSNGLPLSGGVGFELFDRQGVGETEESQRVTYQRALQGELARTIAALNGVRYARVHLVLPEQTVFKRDREEPRASVALILKPGAALGHDQVLGIQRLVGAAVAGLDAGKVVITDQRGVTLSGADESSIGAAASGSRLSIKREVEEYVARKIVTLLDRAYGPGQALVSVDVTLNLDQIKRTVQDLVPLHAETDRPEGAVVRKRQVETRSGSGDTASSEVATGARAGNATTEVEYEFGRRVEEVVAAPGSITRMSVGVVVPGALDETKRSHITDLVRAAAGINAAQGDAIVVEPLDELASNSATAGTKAATGAIGDAADGPAVSATLRAPAATAPASARLRVDTPMALGGAVLAVVLIGGLLLGRGAWRTRRTLSPLERQRLLRELERTLATDSTEHIGSRM